MKWLPSLTKRDKSPDEPDRCVRAEPQFVKQAASCYPVAIPYLSPFMRGSSIAILVTVFLALLVAEAQHVGRTQSVTSHGHGEEHRADEEAREHRESSVSQPQLCDWIDYHCTL